jgi:hypothetical protein
MLFVCIVIVFILAEFAEFVANASCHCFCSGSITLLIGNNNRIGVPDRLVAAGQWHQT